MKLLTALICGTLLFLLSESHAFALVLPQPGASTPAPTPDPGKTPIRQAKLRVRIEKSTFGKTPQGWQYTTVPVCIQESVIPVYDLRSAGPGVGFSQSMDISCPVVYNGLSATVKMGGSITLSKWQIIDTVEDVKAAGVVLEVDQENGNPGTNIFLSADSATRDLSETSFVGSVYPNAYILCSSQTSLPVPSPSAKVKSKLYQTLLNPRSVEKLSDGEDNSTCTASINEFVSATFEITDAP